MPFATITGHSSAAYEQGGMLFDGAGEPLSPEKRAKTDAIIETDDLANAKAFLMTILKNGPLSKSTVYKAAEGNNQAWTDVTRAAEMLPVMKFSYQKQEHWKLSEA